MTVLDIYTRECLAIESEQRLKGQDVVMVLNRIKAQRAVPRMLYCDNGSEFSSQAMDLWAYQNGVRIAFSRPGKPTDNAFVESFNGTFRAECLEINLTPRGWEELRRWQRHVFEKLYALSGYPSTKQQRELRRLTKLAKGRKEAEVGVFLIVNGKLLVRSSPWSAIPPFGGYRTYGLGLCDFCGSLVRGNKVPALTHYDSIPRGRASYDDTSGQFTVYTDLCTAKSERWVRAIRKRFHLPPSTRVIVDAQYARSQCSDQMRKTGYHHMQLDYDWNFLNAVIKWG